MSCADKSKVGFSIRDERTNPMCILRNQRGQGIVEYILALIVGVVLILGGMYQLNTAFKTWATNYFGNYLACLLEAGELPSISGGGGDSGVCNDFFKPFSLAEGRPLKENAKTGGGQATKTGSGAGANDKRAGVSHVSGGGSHFSSGPAFGRGGGNRGFAVKGGKGKGGDSSAFTGSTEASNYGAGYGSKRRIDIQTKTLLDNRFAFDQSGEGREKRKSITSFKRPPDEGGRAPKIRVKRIDHKRDIAAQEDTGLNIPNFLRILIIAAIVIALVFFLGGQALQIGKSMD
jgi:hypothetical protein